ncbi:hypothetical protein FHX63_002387 [Cupriavidus plantarum]|nr:hypothetical protein [Cupriavidus plantarum]
MWSIGSTRMQLLGLPPQRLAKQLGGVDRPTIEYLDQ